MVLIKLSNYFISLSMKRSLWQLPPYRYWIKDLQFSLWVRIMKPCKNLHSYVENIRNKFNFNAFNQGQYLRQWYKIMTSGVTRICTVNLFSYPSAKVTITNCFCDSLNKIIRFLVRFLNLGKKKSNKQTTKFENDRICNQNI